MDPNPDTTGENAAPPIEHPPIVQLQVPPWVQLVGLPMALLFGYLFMRAASHAVIVFLIATLISLLLAPVVRRLVSFGLPRLVSVLVVFGLFAASVTVLSIAAVDLLAQQATELRSSSDEVTTAVVKRIDDLQDFADRRGFNVDLRDQGIQFVEQLSDRSTELSGRALELGREFVAVLAEAAFNVVLIVVISIYMLLDAPRIGRLIASMFPAGTGVETMFGRMQHSLFRYTVGQSLASLVMGVSATVGLYVMGVTGIWEAGERYAVMFGLIVAVTEFAPSIGPVIGSIPPIVVAMFDGVGPTIAVLVFFILLHQIEGHIVIPKLMGAAIAVHPLLVIFGILAGAQLLGIGGILLALPLLAVSRELVQFLRERVALGSWSTDGNVPVLVGPDGIAYRSDPLDTAAAPDVSSGAAPESFTERMRGALARRRGRTTGSQDEP